MTFISCNNIQVISVLTIVLGLQAAIFSQVSPPKIALKASTAQTGGGSMSEMPEVLIAPLFIEAGGFTSRVVMVNDLTFAITADVVLFDRNGAKIISHTVAFRRNGE